MSVEYTPEQLDAIQARDRSLLVSAAAGSGKTQVLTERLIRRITAPDRDQVKDNLDRFLVITYTRAAAAELRNRILENIEKMAAENPDDKNLREQKNYCYHASIGTVHSFCQKLLRENAHLAGISPAFRVTEEEQAEALRAAAADTVLERRYRSIGTDPDFAQLVNTVGAGRDDRALTKVLLDLHGKLRSLPDLMRWIEEQSAALECEDNDDPNQTIWAKEILRFLSEDAQYRIRQIRRAQNCISCGDTKLQNNYGPTVENAAKQFARFGEALATGNWNTAREAVPADFVHLKAIRNCESPDLQKTVKALRDDWEKAAERYASALADPSEVMQATQKKMQPAMRALLSLARDLETEFAAEKRRRAVLDYSDLEHMALKLLEEQNGLAETYSGFFTEVMVDEYQDVNEIQDRIFRALSDNGKKLFLVGDVKQSIYRFRLADPLIFIHKYHNWKKDPAAEGRCILLQDNFRSRRSVLNTVNPVFFDLMTEKLGELDYDNDAALKYGAKWAFEGSEDPASEFCIIDVTPDANGDAPDAVEAEAAYVASRIRAMIDAGTLVYDAKDKPRACRYSDFALLMRSPKANGGVYHRALTAQGIPVSSNYGAGFFQTEDVLIATHLLTLVDNPHADVPLLSVLRAPIFGFTPDELGDIRLYNKDVDYYSALVLSAEAGNEKSAAFLKTLQRWRDMAPDLAPDQLLWRIFEDTHYFTVCAAMPDGNSRRAALMQLFELARDFSIGGETGLHRFLDNLKRMRENDREPEHSEEGNTVKIYTIHKSKGLEFPVVFLCDLNHKFNLTDTFGTVLIHTELGLGPKLTDARRGISYPTPMFTAVQQKIRAETLSEELRVLYVAMTRAKERLIMTCARKKPEEWLDVLRNTNSMPPDPAALLRAINFSDWLGAVAAQENGHLPYQIIPAGSINAPAACVPQPAENIAAEAVPPVLEQLRKNLKGSGYPYQSAVDLPSKITATELKRLETASEQDEDAKPDHRLPKHGGAFRKQGLTAAERGTATHAFLQYVDLEKAGSLTGLASELSRLQAEKRLTAEEAACIDLNSVLEFFTSQTGQRLRNAKEVHREFRFTLLQKAESIYPGCGDDELLLQGIVDCFFIEDDAITLLDYKTDRVDADTVEARAKEYAEQIKAYKNALERIRELPVRHCILWFLTPGKECPVNCENL